MRTSGPVNRSPVPKANPSVAHPQANRPQAIPPLTVHPLTTPLLAACLAICFSACQSPAPPYSPEQALETFQIEDGFRIEIFAAEPDIRDPVAMEFDEFGRIYVVESPGYPLDVETADGKVKLLTDTNSDGLPDSATVFADGLTMPTGVLRWKQGILVTDPPNLLYLEDSDNDGVADIRRVVLSGFAFTNPQHTVSTPLYGLDNWIYLSNEGYTTARVFPDKFGDTGSEIHYPDRPDGPRLAMQRRSLRFRPDSFQLEWLAGSSQYGQAFDTWGHLVQHSNSSHARHEVIASRYLERNPNLRLARPWQNMSDHGDAGSVYPITVNPRFELLTSAGQITSATGLTLYLGGGFAPGFENVSFIGEPAHNLVHADVWETAGTTFVARRAAPEREFLASTDSWFRPANFYIGPDGALYLIDYYRRVIEHPEWTSAETYESKQLYDGTDKGRIYRIVPTDGLPLARDIQLGAATGEELVQHLDHPNIWWRRNAQRLLVDRRGDTAAASGTGTDTGQLLRQLVSESPSAAGRLHALWTLDGIGDLDAATIQAALADPEPGVRENAIILAESRLTKSPETSIPENVSPTAKSALLTQLLKMKDEPNPRVRFQLLCTLGYVEGAAASKLRDQILLEDIEDPWTQVAALSWPSTQASTLLSQATARGGLASKNTEARQEYFRRLGSLGGSARDSRQIGALVNTIAKRANPQASWWRAAVLEGLANGLQGGEQEAKPGAETSPNSETVNSATSAKLLALFTETDPAVRRAAVSVLESAGLPPGAAATRKAIAQAARLAQDTQAGPEHRVDAVRLLALGGPQAVNAALASQAASSSRSQQSAQASSPALSPASAQASPPSSSPASSPSSSPPTSLEDLLVALIDTSQPEPVQAAAVKAYGQLEGPAPADFFLKRWRSMTPPVRTAAAQALISTPERIITLLDAIEEGAVQPWTLGSARGLIMMQEDPEVRQRARRLMLAPQKEREEVVERYRAALALEGDPARGAQVFEQICSKCHLFNGIGHEVGPDLETIRGRPAYLLLNDILMPNQSIAQTYEAYVIETQDGRTIDGVIGPQSPTSITLRREGGEEDSIQRQNIKTMYASDLSAMAADLEEQITPQQMADLIHYIKTAN